MKAVRKKTADNLYRITCATITGLSLISAALTHASSATGRATAAESYIAEKLTHYAGGSDAADISSVNCITPWMPLTNEPLLCTYADSQIPRGPDFAAAGLCFRRNGVLPHGAILLAAGADDSTYDHERRHCAEQNPPTFQTAADYILWGTFEEADAYLHEIILAYQHYLRHGDESRWRAARQMTPEMVAVFDEMVRTEAGGQSLDALRAGRDPLPEIMRATAMAYFFSDTAQHYLPLYFSDLNQPPETPFPVMGADGRFRDPTQTEIDNWFLARQAFQQEIGPENITLNIADIGARLQRGGVNYLGAQTGDNITTAYNWLLQRDYTGTAAARVAATGPCYIDERTSRARLQAENTDEVFIIMGRSRMAPACEAGYLTYDEIAHDAAGIGSLRDTINSLGDSPLQPFRPPSSIAARAAPTDSTGLRGLQAD